MYGSSLNQKLIIVTGAAGFIGSGVVRFLNDQGIDRLVLVDDIKKTDKWKNLLGKRFVNCLSRYQLFSWLEGKQDEIGAFIHLGACSDTMELDGDFLMENNFRYTVRLAEYALRYGHRFIYASSAATYGNGSLGFQDDHDSLEKLQPLNLYGFSKYCFDVWAKQNHVLDRLVGLKYFNVFGPNEHHKGRMASMVYKMVPLVQTEGVIRLFKSTDPVRFQDGDQCRDFIYVKDAVRMTCHFLSNDSGGIFNIGSGEAVTWNRLARAVFAALNQPVHMEYVEMPPELAKQYQNYTKADMRKYAERLNADSAYSMSASNRVVELSCASSIQDAALLDPPLCQFSIEEAVFDYVTHYLSKDTRW